RGGPRTAAGRRPARRAASGHDRLRVGGGALRRPGRPYSGADVEPERRRLRSLARALERARLYREARPHGSSVHSARGRCVVRVVRLLVWLAGGALSATMIVGAIHGHVLPADQAAAGYAAAFVAVTIGVIALQ